MYGEGEKIFSLYGQNCPENTWERTNLSSGVGGGGLQDSMYDITA